MLAGRLLDKDVRQILPENSALGQHNVFFAILTAKMAVISQLANILD